MEFRYNIEHIASTAKTVLESVLPQEQGATILGFSGDLGAGKTTLTQAIASLLGVTETVVSPTFTIAKFYSIQTVAFDTLVHIDAYRIESTEELVPLGFAQLTEQPRTLIIIEWPERISSVLPKTTQYFLINHADTERVISTVI